MEGQESEECVSPLDLLPRWGRSHTAPEESMQGAIGESLQVPSSPQAAQTACHPPWGHTGQVVGSGGGLVL